MKLAVYGDENDADVKQAATSREDAAALL